MPCKCKVSGSLLVHSVLCSLEVSPRETESKCSHEVSIWSMADLRLVNRPRNGRAEAYQRLDMHLQKPPFSMGRGGGVPFQRLHRTMHGVKRC